MALQNRDFSVYSADGIFPIELRQIIGPGPGAVRTANFATGSGTLAKGTAVAQVGANIVPYAYVDGTFTEGTAEVIVGFLYDDVELDAGGEVVGNFMAIGQMDYRDVPLTGAGNQAQLETALSQLSLRQRNLQITGGLARTN